MKQSLMNILVCPACKGPLKLIIHQEENNEIVEGALRCNSCEYSYKIEDSIPNLLPPETASDQTDFST